MLRKAHSILVDGSHVLYPMFEIMPSGRRFRCPPCKTNCKNSSFIPVAISLFNYVKRRYIRYVCICIYVYVNIYIYIYKYIYICVIYIYIHIYIYIYIMNVSRIIFVTHVIPNAR